MPELVLSKIDGTFSQIEHHKIAKIVKLASINAEIIDVQTHKPKDKKLLKELQDEVMQLISELTAEAVVIPPIVMTKYNYSIGLIMGKELLISALPENIDNLKQNINTGITAARIE